MNEIGILGGGAAGIGAARRLLDAGAQVTLFEAGDRLGGNCRPGRVVGEGGEVFEFDVGVSDFNRATFREFARLLDELGIATRPIGTDTSFRDTDGRTLASCRAGAWTFHDSPAELLDEDFAAKATAFRLRAVEALDTERFAGWSLGRYLDHLGTSRALRDLYVYPRAAGSFPMPGCQPRDLPLRELIEFWRIHGVVGATPADRHAVVGGMHRYPGVFAAWFRRQGGALHLRTRAERLVRTRRGVEVHSIDADGRRARHRFDAVVFAGRPDQALEALTAPSPLERAALRRFGGQRARVVIHRDPAVVGDRPAQFGAFNYVVRPTAAAPPTPTITFHPNRLAGLPAHAPDVFVTMNPDREPDPDLVIAESWFVHPLAGPRQRAAAWTLENLQGHGGLWFANSFLRSPFVHESALQSGMLAAERVLAASTGRVLRVAR